MPLLNHAPCSACFLPHQPGSGYFISEPDSVFLSLDTDVIVSFPLCSMLDRWKARPFLRLQEDFVNQILNIFQILPLKFHLYLLTLPLCHPQTLQDSCPSAPMTRGLGTCKCYAIVFSLPVTEGGFPCPAWPIIHSLTWPFSLYCP